MPERHFFRAVQIVSVPFPFLLMLEHVHPLLVGLLVGGWRAFPWAGDHAVLLLLQSSSGNKELTGH